MLLNDIPFIMIKCLSLTIIIELMIAFILKVRDKKDLLNVVLVNIMTNPIVVTVPIYFNIRYNIMARNIVLYILEILAVLSEGLVYKKCLNYRKINPFLLSLILNCCSYFIGEIINYFKF